MRISLLTYGADHREWRADCFVEDCMPGGHGSSITWINVSGVHDVSIIETLGTRYGVHALVLEDIVHTHQRPKIEDHGDYLYLVMRMLSLDETSGEIRGEQVSLILGKSWLITFQEKPGDLFDPVRERSKNPQGRIRRFGADYLAYALVDAIVDHYFILLEKIGDRLEVLEEEIRSHPTPEVLHRIHGLKREMIYLRKSIWPVREVVSQLDKDELPLIRKQTKLYLRDIYDHTIQIMEGVDSFRDMLAGLQDLYLSLASNRMNEAMKVLTIIATIFMPPTFFAGIYGMNFDHMPELHLPYGYFVVLGVMTISVCVMLVYFRRRNWL